MASAAISGRQINWLQNHRDSPLALAYVAREFPGALNREVTYCGVPVEDWERELKGLPEHLSRHFVTMGELHRAGRYARLADSVERVTGRPAMSVREFVSLNADE